MHARCGKYTNGMHTNSIPRYLTVNGLKLKEVDNFTYLGSIFSKAVYNDEISARSAKANVAFGRL